MGVLWDMYICTFTENGELALKMSQCSYRSVSPTSNIHAVRRPACRHVERVTSLNQVREPWISQRGGSKAASSQPVYVCSSINHVELTTSNPPTCGMWLTRTAEHS